MSQNVYILDIEADELYPYQENVWVIYIRKLGGDELMIKPETFQGNIKDTILGFIFREPNPIIVAHNGLGYDFWVLWKEYGLEISCGPDKICGQPCTFFDTLYASQYLLPDRIGGHSLESWGIRVGNHKIDFREKCIELGIIPANAEKGDEFKQYTYLMDEYCIQDVAVTSDVFVALWTQLLEERTYNAFRLGQKSFFLMAAQGFTGVKFDIEEALRLKPMIEEVMNEIKSLVDPNLPQRPLKKSEEAHYKIPAKPFKQNGDLSATFVKWLEKHDAIFDGVSIIAYGNKFEFIPNCILPVSLPMSINDQKELKQFFLDSGWEPTMYNYKKDKKGKPIRDDYGQLIETSPKIQEAGVICPNLLELDGEIPKSVVKYLSYKNRLSTLKGWLKNDRLKFDGRLTSGNSGIASTHRQKHTVVVNVPKAEDGVILGKEFRGLFMVDEGNTMVGCDQAALEARVQGHWTFKYDNGATAKRLLEGDPHCYSEDTQILTPSGWKYFGDISPDDKVAQWDNGEISFVVPSEIIWQEYNGEMISVKGKHLDMLVTPNHRILYKIDSDPTPNRVKLASELNNRDSRIRVPSSGNLVGSEINIPSSVIKLIVAIQADGYITPYGGIRFAFTKKRKLERLLNILNDIPECSWKRGKNHIRKNRPEYKINIHVNEFTKSLIGKYISTKKIISRDLLQLGIKGRHTFINEIVHWDGTLTKSNGVILDTTCKDTVELVQIMCHTSNRLCYTSEFQRTSGFSPCYLYRANIPFHEKMPWYATLKSNIETVEYNGKIGCVTVPSSFILVKKGNCIMVSGNSRNTKAFYPEETKDFDIEAEDFDSSHPKFKPFRSKSKNGGYAIMYGCSAGKLAGTLGKPVSLGTTLLEAFWKANQGLKDLKDAVESYWENHGDGRWIPGIDGRRLHSRSKHSLINLLFQSTGAIIVDYSTVLFDHYLGGLSIDELGRPYYPYKGKKVKRILYFHDEFQAECPIEYGQEIGELMERCMSEAGERLKLSIPLTGNSAIGPTWRDTH